MIDAFKKMSLRRRVAFALRGVNVVVCPVLIAFALC
jgi:hypothetical protein